MTCPAGQRQRSGAPSTWFTTILDAPDVLALALVYYLLGFLVYAVLMGGVGALGSSLQESQQVAGIFTFFAILPVMFAGILNGQRPGLQQIVHILRQT